MSQELAIEKIKSGENVVVLGQAGTGKTYTIDQIVDQNTVKCAPTGIAALNVGGMTCHSMFNLPVGKPSDEDYFVVGKTMERLFGSGSPITRVCCDEIGMLRADYLDMIDSKLRTLRRNTKPFGGIQFVGSGDFYQLEPIIGRDEVRYFNKRYNSPYCFDADSWDFSLTRFVSLCRPFILSSDSSKEKETSLDKRASLFVISSLITELSLSSKLLLEIFSLIKFNFTPAFKRPLDITDIEARTLSSVFAVCPSSNEFIYLNLS